MPVHELYSKRKLRVERGDSPEVYSYDELPERLRTQIRQILTAAIGGYYVVRGHEFGVVPSNNNDAWRKLDEILCREYGVDELFPGTTPYEGVMGFIRVADTDDVLNTVELSARYIERIMSKVGKHQLREFGATQEARSAIDELNFRFRDAGVGYQYDNGNIIRVDSQLVHNEVVKSALTLLSDPRFKGAEQEFLEAHHCYRCGDNKGAVTGANRAFESAMKAICDLKNWTYEKKAPASKLIKILQSRGLFPDYLDASFNQLLATLQSGLPQVRNNAGGHGQGATPRLTPDYVAAYALHLAAVNIVFLTEAALTEATSE